MKKTRVWAAIVGLSLTLSQAGITGANAAAFPDCTISIYDSNSSADGTAGNDVICIFADSVTVRAMGGDDTVGDFGVNNTIDLGDGADYYYGNFNVTSDAVVEGGDGDDQILGTPGDDSLSGGLGDDTLYGYDGSDSETGGDGADNLIGYAGDDSMDGGAGADWLDGGAGDDGLIGGDGFDLLDGGDGINICDYTPGETLQSSCKYDDSAPVVVSATVDTASVEVGVSSADFTATIHLTDEIGVSYGWISCGSSRGGGFGYDKKTGLWSSIFNQVVSATGTPRDITVTVVGTIPLGTAPGLYTCNVTAVDSLGHSTSVSSGASLQVYRGGASWDDAAPTVVSATIDTESVDVGSAAADFTATLHITDDTGVSYGWISCGSSMGGGFGYDKNTGQWTSTFNQIVSATGTPQDLTIIVVGTVRYGTAPGLMGCNVTVADTLNHSNTVSGPSLQVYRSGSTWDDSAPAVVSATIDTDSVDVGAADADFTATLHLTDETGISYGWISCGSSKGGGFGYDKNTGEWTSTFNKVVSATGDAKDLTIVVVGTAPFGALPGRQSCTVTVSDTLNHSASVSGPALTIFRTPAGQPSAPQSGVFTPIDATSGTFSWAAPDNLGSPKLTGYTVEISSDGTTWTKVSNGSTKNTQLTVSGLSADTDYMIRVRGENGATLGADTTYMHLNYEQTSFHTAAAIAPSTPLNLRASKVTSTGFQLDWGAPASNGGSALTGTLVEYSSDSGATWKSLGTPTQNTLVVSNASPGTAYLVRVSAVNSAGTSSPSASLSVSTTDSVPTVVSGLAVKSAKTSIVLSWKASSKVGASKVSNYLVEYSKDKGKTWLTVKKAVSTLTSVTIKGLKSRTAYQFRVSAVNKAGKSAASKVLKIVTK